MGISHFQTHSLNFQHISSERKTCWLIGRPEFVLGVYSFQESKVLRSHPSLLQGFSRWIGFGETLQDTMRFSQEIIPVFFPANTNPLIPSFAEKCQPPLDPRLLCHSLHLHPGQIGSWCWRSSIMGKKKKHGQTIHSDSQISQTKKV